MNYCAARVTKSEREKSRDIYITDAMRLIGENVARRVGGEYLSKRWADLTTVKKKNDGRSGEEIAADVITRCGLVVNEG